MTASVVQQVAHDPSKVIGVAVDLGCRHAVGVDGAVLRWRRPAGSRRGRCRRGRAGRSLRPAPGRPGRGSSRSSIRRWRAHRSPPAGSRRVAVTSAAPGARSSASSSARMRVSGVRSSWEASATKRCWRRADACSRSSMPFIVSARRLISSPLRAARDPPVELGRADRRHLGPDPLDGAQRAPDDDPDEEAQQRPSRRGTIHSQRGRGATQIALVDVLELPAEVDHTQAVGADGEPVLITSADHRCRRDAIVVGDAARTSVGEGVAVDVGGDGEPWPVDRRRPRCGRHPSSDATIDLERRRPGAPASAASESSRCLHAARRADARTQQDARPPMRTSSTPRVASGGDPERTDGRRAGTRSAMAPSMR